jgi:hypothetical protein
MGTNSHLFFSEVAAEKIGLGRVNALEVWFFERLVGATAVLAVLLGVFPLVFSVSVEYPPGV